MSHVQTSSESKSPELRLPTTETPIPIGSNGRAEAFLATLREAECDICGDRFNEIHVPVRLRCRHIAGLNCIRNRVLSPIQSHNKCLKCKAVLFDNGLPAPNQRGVDQDSSAARQLGNPRLCHQTRVSSGSVDSVHDAPPVVGRFSRPPTLSKMSPAIPLQQQHLQRHIDDLHQFVLLSSAPPEPRAHLLSLPGTARIPRPPSSQGPPVSPCNSPPTYSRNAPSHSTAQHLEHDKWLGGESNRRPLAGSRKREDSSMSDLSPYPSFTDNLPLIEYLTEAHTNLDPQPQEGVRGVWPYQYPAILQPHFDSSHDTELHCLAESIVARRWEVLRRRGLLQHLRCHPVQEENQPEYDVEAVKRMLCAGWTGQAVD